MGDNERRDVKGPEEERARVRLLPAAPDAHRGPDAHGEKDAPAESGRIAGLIGALSDRLPFDLHDRVRPDADEEIEEPRPAGRARRAGTFLSYAQSAFDTFSERPFCELDSIVFSWLSYFRLPAAMRETWSPRGIALHELLRAEEFEQMFGTSWDPEGSRDLLFAVCASPRFREARLAAFDFKTDQATSEQFASMTFVLPGAGAYVAFRGTDSTLVGWREDFNMASLCPVPAQREAHEYLGRVAALIDGPLYVGGHSKGGNLAVYAAACAAPEVQDRIVRVYSHDGPGFPADFLASEGYARIRGRVEKTVPKSSIIGLIMDADHDFDVVESDGISVLQHNPFLWEVEGCAFRRADGLSASSRYFASTVAAWMGRFTPEERGAFIDTLFGVIDVTGAVRMADIREDWRQSLPAMREAYDALAPEQRAFVGDVMRALARVATIDRMSDAATSVLDALGIERDG